MKCNQQIRRFRLALLATMIAVTATKSAEPIGWRTDGTGNYPKTKPPVVWSPEKNVIWKTPMPGASNSHPVLVGSKIFICAEPSTLLCLKREDGSILWKKTCTIDELELDSALREKIKAEQAEAARLDKETAVLNREAEMFRKKLGDDAAKKDELARAIAEIKTKTEALKEKKNKLALANRYTERGKQGTAGYTTPTPATDGKEIFAVFGNGLVACFDLDGNRKWLKLIEQSTAPFAHSSSPVLVGDKLIVHFADMVALNTADGAELWRLKKTPPHGTPLHARIGGSDVVITPNGLAVRVNDGTVLAESLGSCGANSPILHDGVAYFVRGTASAVRLPDSLAEPTKIAPLWKGKVKGNGYWFPSPVLHDGLLYTVDDRGMFSALDAKTGKMIYEERLEIDGMLYPSLAAAGNHIYVSSDSGVTLVVKAGPKHEVIAENRLEPFRSSPVFDGTRMYLRTLKHLYCIGE